MPDNLNNLVLIGAGKMAQAYAKALVAQGQPFTLVGRSEERVESFKEQYPSILAISGGIDSFLKSNSAPESAIIAANITYMVDIAKSLIVAGTKYLLLEKPGALSVSSLQSLESLAKEKGAQVYIGYNRRFYASVTKAMKLIAEDGGLSSVHFEFTEMIHKIKRAKHGEKALAKWVLSNSSHVIDTVFHLAGQPKELMAKVSGNAVDWHPSGSVFVGMGETDRGIPFTYHANWGSAGRWNIELNTSENRYILSPMEKLKVQKRGEMNIVEIELDDQLDLDYKPGIYRQTEAFLSQASETYLVSISSLIEEFRTLNRMAAYV